MMIPRETTGFVDRNGEELFLGDVVRTEVEEPFREAHGAWADYEITKAAGGYVLSYVQSETGCILPFGYTATFLNQFAINDLPDLKMLLWSKKPIKHPAICKIEDGLSPDERRELFIRAKNARGRKRGAA